MLITGAAALTCVLWGENMAYRITVLQTIGDDTRTDETVNITKLVDISAVTVSIAGRDHLINPLNGTRYNCMNGTITRARVDAIRANNPDIITVLDASIAAQTNPQITTLTTDVGWCFYERSYITPNTTDRIAYYRSILWGSRNACASNSAYTVTQAGVDIIFISRKIESGEYAGEYYGVIYDYHSSTNIQWFLVQKDAWGAQAEPLPMTPTGGAGGFGSYDNRTDVNVNIGVKGSGFLSGILGNGFHFYYVPDYSELVKAMYYHINGVNNLSDWTNNTMALFLAPANYVVSATALPCNRGIFHPQGGESRSLSMGGLLDWNVRCYELSRLWGDSGEYYYDFNEDKKKLYFDDYRDFEPFTKISLYLPYIGTVPLKASECNGGRIGVVYRFDGISGKCLAMIKTTDRNGRQTGYYQYGGNAGFALPWIGNNGGGSQMIHSAASAVAGIDRKPVEQVPNGGVDVSGNFKYGAEALAALKITESYIQNTQPHMHGGFGVNTGALGADDIVLVIQRAQFANPDNYYDIHGFQTATGGVCGDYSGYTEFNLVELVECEATQPEQDEILQLLKRGVYL